MQRQQEGKPKWLESFLDIKNFFSSCPKHKSNEGRKKLLNLYCINCETSICSMCMKQDSGNSSHHVIKLYRLGHQEAVRVNDMTPYLNCKKIQTYLCNGVAVISLHTLMHDEKKKDLEKSPSPALSVLDKPRRHCDVCPRSLHSGHQFIFCSIHCKVSLHEYGGWIEGPPIFLAPRSEPRKRVIEQRRRRGRGRRERAKHCPSATAAEESEQEEGNPSKGSFLLSSERCDLKVKGYYYELDN
ncbi:hypothetical protein QQ045_014961 [Rhodiola kirilowii]